MKNKKSERVVIVKKTFLLEDLDCAHCAAKIEDAVSKIDGVEKATVNFLKSNGGGARGSVFCHYEKSGESGF